MENDRKQLIERASEMIYSHDAELQFLGWQIIKNMPVEDIRDACDHMDSMDIVQLLQ
jgi:hypothetical protein